ncbi:hypothetical protein DYB38_007317 [Aphanomyces astaci]|uniref:Uncharacterized protein n=3 Tax=Aphanomyces astaci TaxID=112090 RepID=A0A397CXU9_APHAT|nr:hypothetical protein DYB38_007317 [Aphanomyces astaci]
MNIDTALFKVIYSGADNVTLFAIHDNCWECDLRPTVRNNCKPGIETSCVSFAAAADFNFTTVYPWDLELRKSSDNTTVLWSSRQSFDEHATYQLNVTADAATGKVITSTYAQIVTGSSSSALPFVLLGLVLMWIVGCFGSFFWKKQTTVTVVKSPGLQEEMLPRGSRDDGLCAPQATALPLQVQDVAAPVVAPKKERVVCLDVFRGIDLFYMIFCNQGGGGYWFFEHAAWNGIMPTDFVFPFFAFIMGVTMNIGMSSHEKKGTALWRVLFDHAIRSVKLFLLGLYCNNYRNLTTGRIPGVLQSFGFAYLVCAIAIVAGRACQSASIPALRRAVEGGIILAVVAIYLLVAFFLPVEGCPRGYFGPGGDSEHGKYPNCIGGAHLVVDRAIFGDIHLYQHGTSGKIYNTKGGWDPEGFLTWLMVAFCCYIGYFFGGLFLRESCWKKKVSVLAIPGVVMILLALILCGFKINGGWIPLNKNLWSLSYTLCTSGAGCVMLALLYVAVDKFKVWDGVPFKYNGMNSILLYIGVRLFDMILYHVYDVHGWIDVASNVV